MQSRQTSNICSSTRTSRRVANRSATRKYESQSVAFTRIHNLRRTIRHRSVTLFAIDQNATAVALRGRDEPYLFPFHFLLDASPQIETNALSAHWDMLQRLQVRLLCISLASRPELCKKHLPARLGRLV